MCMSFGRYLKLVVATCKIGYHRVLLTGIYLSHDLTGGWEHARPYLNSLVEATKVSHQSELCYILVLRNPVPWEDV